MKQNFLVDLSKQFAVDIVNLCTDIKENLKIHFAAVRGNISKKRPIEKWRGVGNEIEI